MAIFAEVGISPAEPLRNRAAELALILDVVMSMAFAMTDAPADVGRHAGSTYQVFDLELLLLLLRLDAVFHPSVVRILALEALIIGEFEHAPPTQIVVVIASRLPHPCILVDALVLGSDQCLLLHVPFKR